MIKRILAGAAAAGFAATLFAAGPASAAPCTSDTPPSHTPAPGTRQPTTPGGEAYADGGAGGGYIGLKGNNGWIEAGGAPNASGGYVRGNSNPDAVEGNLQAGQSSQKLCVNGTPVK